MGALKGSIAIRRYAVLDDLPGSEPRQKLTRGLRAHRFLPLVPDGDNARAGETARAPGDPSADRSVGWVSILDANDSELRADNVFFAASGGEHLRVALRIDVLKPPAAEVRRQLAARVATQEAAEGRALSRREKALLKEEVVRRLRQRAFPRVRVVDVVWNLDRRRVYLWSQTKAVNEAFLDLFAKSFGLRLEIEGPARWARAASPERELAALEPTPELWLGFAGLRPLSVEAPTEDA